MQTSREQGVESSDPSDLQLFGTGFYAYQQENFQVAVRNMRILLRRFPDSSLRDMALFWLAQALFRAGSMADAAHCMAQFLRECPDQDDAARDVDEELMNLTRLYIETMPLPWPPLE